MRISFLLILILILKNGFAAELDKTHLLKHSDISLGMTKEEVLKIEKPLFEYSTNNEERYQFRGDTIIKVKDFEFERSFLFKNHEGVFYLTSILLSSADYEYLTNEDMLTSKKDLDEVFKNTVNKYNNTAIRDEYNKKVWKITPVFTEDEDYCYRTKPEGFSETFKLHFNNSNIIIYLNSGLCQKEQSKYKDFYWKINSSINYRIEDEEIYFRELRKKLELDDF